MKSFLSPPYVANTTLIRIIDSFAVVVLVVDPSVCVCVCTLEC